MLLDNMASRASCETVMSKGCVAWKDKSTSFDCTCNTNTIKLKNAKLSKHLNIYSGFCKFKNNSQILF
jgi:hypothetical protein